MAWKNIGGRKSIDWREAQRIYDSGVNMAAVARAMGVGVSYIGVGSRSGLLKARAKRDAALAGWKNETPDARAKRMAAAQAAARATDVVKRRAESRMLSDYVTSGRLSRQAKKQARDAGLASGRARALSQEEGALRQKFSACRTSARIRGFDFTLSVEEFRSLVKADCWYCGGKPSHTWKRKFPKAPLVNGIDRLDNAKGYIIGNVVPCCGKCNRAKHTMPVDEFLNLVKRIAERHSDGTDASS